jgi:hypothetical protein
MSTEIVEINDDLELVHLSPTIAAELAAGLTSPESVPKKYNMTDEQWERLKRSKLFLAMLTDAGQRFKGDLGASARITLKSEILLEEALPVLGEIVHNSDIGSQQKIDSVKQLSVLAGRTQRQEGSKGGVGAGFNVNIHINTGEEATSAPIVISGSED